MMTVEQPTTTLWRPPDAMPFDEAQLAAAAFLARYSGRTLDAYRHAPRRVPLPVDLPYARPVDLLRAARLKLV